MKSKGSQAPLFFVSCRNGDKKNTWTVDEVTYNSVLELLGEPPLEFIRDSFMRGDEKIVRSSCTFSNGAIHSLQMAVGDDNGNEEWCYQFIEHRLLAASMNTKELREAVSKYGDML